MSSKIVIDTSVFISALIGPKGPSRELIRLCLRGKFLPLFSNTLFNEYESVTRREEILAQCSLGPDEILELTQAFISVSRWINIYYAWRPNLKDEAENHLIEIAVAGNARMIATNNLRDFKNAELLFPELCIARPETIIRR